ncbi:uncharacterized protein LOC142574292 isoform X2 [Dermacentor variabilis]|uniref:uncharacterized protein LOC142572648 isoform X3 n=1 Tax=Dermacentor variabilis TaxID=34621 RepID=UPI002417D7A9|nr:uncharacterized protein LOC129380996 isoform X2 [Dermacentor andersoni]
MPKNQNTLACYLDKKTSMDNPGRAFLSTQSTAKSDSNTGHQWNSAVPLQCCGNCLHQRLCNSCFAACRRQCLRNYWP